MAKPKRRARTVARVRRVQRRPARAAKPPVATVTQPSASGLARRAPLERERRRLSDAERLESGLGALDARTLSSARAGHDELKAELKRHTESSPALTAGDVDADWQEAYAIGDETPGGDNPTPGQDRVDDIGKALGISYAADQELAGGDEVTARDQHRWELDPASSEDWPHRDEEGKE